MGGQVGVPGGPHRRHRGNAAAKEQAYRQSEAYRENRRIYEQNPEVIMKRRLRAQVKRKP